MKTILIFIILVISFQLHAQDKRGNTWVCGNWAMTATFTDTSKPVLGQLFNGPGNGGAFLTSTSNICDSATGKLLFMCNGARIWDTLGNIMENGDSVIPTKLYKHNNPPIGQCTQGSLILPKGSNGLYYLFTPTMTDSMYDYWITNPLGDNRAPFDLIQYHIVDMNANGGMGKVIQKNIKLLENAAMAKVGMMACRHANGYDWWLIKQGFDTNKVFTFLVTKDTVELKHIQTFAEPRFGFYDLRGQACFSTDGSKYAFATGGVNSNGAQLYIADFDRCTGILSNTKIVNVPVENTNEPYLENIGRKDSAIIGLCFSPNDSFLYINKSFNVYQFEYNNPDSSQAWYRVHRYDTLAEYLLFGQMQLGIDGRIYMGKFSGNEKHNNVINKPNIKGAGCAYCQFCMDFSFLNNVASTSPPNMPDFNLGPKPGPCWPLTTPSIEKNREALFVYPNPSHTTFYFKNKTGHRKYLYNTLGQLIHTTTSNEMDIRGVPPGVYYVQCDGETRKVVVE
jgi:hypothetical protein